MIVAENQAVLAAARAEAAKPPAPLSFTLAPQMSKAAGEGHGPDSSSPGTRGTPDSPPEPS